MAKTSDIRQNGGTGDDASAEFARVAADMLRNSPTMTIHPLMAHPAAAFAAAAAVGFGVASQIAGAFFGAFQAAAETANNRAADPIEENHAVEEKAAVKKSGAVDVKPMKASPAAAPAVKPAATKPVAAKPKLPAAKKVASKPAIAVAASPAKSKAPVKSKAKVESPVEAAVKPAPARGRKPAVRADDLKQISGIGPKLEQVLNGRDIQRFADIAGWSDTDIDRIDAEFGFDGRIRRDDWVGQAKALLAKGRS